MPVSQSILRGRYSSMKLAEAGPVVSVSCGSRMFLAVVDIVPSGGETWDNRKATRI